MAVVGAKWRVTIVVGFLNMWTVISYSHVNARNNNFMQVTKRVCMISEPYI